MADNIRMSIETHTATSLKLDKRTITLVTPVSDLGLSWQCV